MAQRVNADQREIDGRVPKGVRVEHPSGNQPFLAGFSDHTKMAFPFCVLLPQDCAPLTVERMVGVADLDPRSMMMGIMLSLRFLALPRYWPISLATPIASPSQIAA